MENLTKFPNIGPVLAEKLNKIGITTFDQLVDLGSIEAVLRIGERDMSICYSMLYALEGAIRGIRWHGIPKDQRAQLKASFDQALSVAQS
jgi:DNA transformation protein